MNINSYNFWLTILDAWRTKFSFELTREQACEILLDERKWDKDLQAFLEPSMKDLYFDDYDDFLYEVMKNNMEAKKMNKIIIKGDVILENCAEMPKFNGIIQIDGNLTIKLSHNTNIEDIREYTSKVADTIKMTGNSGAGPIEEVIIAGCCPHCGKELGSSGGGKCPHCGTALNC